MLPVLSGPFDRWYRPYENFRLYHAPQSGFLFRLQQSWFIG
jgi:hypothetical protein